MLTVNYTLALFAQIATQLGPFFVVPLSQLILPNEHLPKYLFPAMTISFLAAGLVMIGQAEAMPDCIRLTLILALTLTVFGGDAGRPHGSRCLRFGSCPHFCDIQCPYESLYEMV